MYIFKLACGCELPRPECEEISYTDSVTKKSYTRLGCAKHMCAERREVLFVCECCGEIEVNPRKITSKRYCVICAKSIIKKRNRARSYLKESLKRSFKRLPVKEEVKSDCIWYLKRCLPLAAKVPSYKNKLNCTGCIRYKRHDLDIMDYIECRYDPLVAAKEKYGIRRAGRGLGI